MLIFPYTNDNIWYDLFKIRDRNHYTNSFDVFRFPNTVTCDKYMPTFIAALPFTCTPTMPSMYPLSRILESQLLHQMKNCTPDPRRLTCHRLRHQSC